MSMQVCLMITVAHTCFALLIAIDNINTVCEIGLVMTITDLCHVYCILFITFRTIAHVQVFDWQIMEYMQLFITNSSNID